MSASHQSGTNCPWAEHREDYVQNIPLLSHFKNQTPGRITQINLFKELPNFHNISTVLGQMCHKYRYCLYDFHILPFWKPPTSSEASSVGNLMGNKHHEGFGARQPGKWILPGLETRPWKSTAQISNRHLFSVSEIHRALGLMAEYLIRSDNCYQRRAGNIFSNKERKIQNKKYTAVDERKHFNRSHTNPFRIHNKKINTTKCLMRVNYKEKVRKRSGTERGVPALFSLVLRKTQTILCPFPQ